MKRPDSRENRLYYCQELIKLAEANGYAKKTLKMDTPCNVSSVGSKHVITAIKFIYESWITGEQEKGNSLDISNCAVWQLEKVLECVKAQFELNKEKVLSAENVYTEIVFESEHGKYIPKLFVEKYGKHKKYDSICMADGSPITDTYLLECLNDDLRQEDNRYYDDAWVTALLSVHMVKDNGQETEIFSLFQDGDLYAISQKDLNKLSDEEKVKFWERFKK